MVLHVSPQYIEHITDSASTTSGTKLSERSQKPLTVSSSSSSEIAAQQQKTRVVSDTVKIAPSEQPSHIIQVEVKTPPIEGQSMDTSWSDYSGIGAVILSLITLFYTSHQNRKLKQQSIEEVFWMREVLIPHFMDNFLQFVKDSPSKFSESNQNKGLFYAQYALERLNELRESLILVQAIDDSLKQELDKAIEEFDELMGEDTDMNSPMLNEALTDMTKTVIQAIQRAQYGLG